MSAPLCEAGTGQCAGHVQTHPQRANSHLNNSERVSLPVVCHVTCPATAVAAVADSLRALNHRVQKVKETVTAGVVSSREELVRVTV